MKCQEYGHTKNYCFKSPVCVKCAKKHLTSECPIKEKIQSVKCANCDGNHPASYKGCIVRKQLQQKLFPTLRTKRLYQNENSQFNQNQNNSVRHNVSFAQAVNGNVNSIAKHQNKRKYKRTHPQQETNR